jgi:hypothetical protein
MKMELAYLNGAIRIVGYGRRIVSCLLIQKCFGV